MPLSWNEIKERAVKFSKEWSNTYREEADAKPFLVDFFNVFGISQRKVSTFEHKVKRLNNHDGYIDLFWKGTLLIEMKSQGRDLNVALEQAQGYLQKVPQIELPRYILVCDFQTFRLHDQEEEKVIEFKLNDFVKNIQHFGFIAGYQKRIYKEQDPVNIQAAELMGKLHDRLKAVGYDGHSLELYLVRLLFCLFADDTTIFDKDIFHDFISQRTNEDGSDLAARLNELFHILNTPKEKRLKNIDEQINAFPYVNGKLFEEPLPPASFDNSMRQNLLDCCMLNWGKISPAIFGSMFQSVMKPEERRNLGAHYTSEKNILKVIKPLFLDELYEEFEKVKGNKNKLGEFHKKLGNLTFLDPACGCGNFLVIIYRELRILELKILQEVYKSEQTILGVENVIWIDVDQFYGIEIEEFPARIAEVAMWLIDHQMNMLISEEFGQYFVRLPLKKSATIVNSDALSINWKEIILPEKLSFILGNPPFIGSKLMNQKQRDKITELFGEKTGAGTLDFVTGWYIKAAKFIQGTAIKVGFVSTNSIVQGEQTGILWNLLMNHFKIKIHFAHRTFKWSNEAKGNAAVYCVIVGFAQFDSYSKSLFEYDSVTSEPQQIAVKNINAYLVDAKNIFIQGKGNPICKVPKMSFGNMPLDGGNLIFSNDEKNEFVGKEPGAIKYLRPLLSAEEFINGKNRYCLWLQNTQPAELSQFPEILKKISAVRNFRMLSTRKATNQKADTPYLFGEIRQPDSDFILIPRHSSENRKYIPIGFFDSNFIASDSCMFIPLTNFFHFGIMTSQMHMAWIKTVCGRIKSDFRYSKDIVYNNFPWPENPNEKQKTTISDLAENILTVRKLYPESSLADLYNPLLMPEKLVKAHQALDRAVDLAYRPQQFISDTKRVEFLFELYEKYTADLFVVEKVKGRNSKSIK